MLTLNSSLVTFILGVVAQETTLQLGTTFVLTPDHFLGTVAGVTVVRKVTTKLLTTEVTDDPPARTEILHMVVQVCPGQVGAALVGTLDGVEPTHC